VPAARGALPPRKLPHGFPDSLRNGGIPVPAASGALLCAVDGRVTFGEAQPATGSSARNSAGCVSLHRLGRLRPRHLRRRIGYVAVH